VKLSPRSDSTAWRADAANYLARRKAHDCGRQGAVGRFGTVPARAGSTTHGYPRRARHIKWLLTTLRMNATGRDADRFTAEQRFETMPPIPNRMSRATSRRADFREQIRCGT
jgi:hypothetical protein